MAQVIAALAGIAVVFVGWSIVGFVVGGVYYLVTPVPVTTGRCGPSITLQALWDRMPFAAKLACYMNFLAAQAVCRAIGCPIFL